MGINMSKDESEITSKEETTNPASSYIVQIAEHTSRELIRIAQPDVKDFINKHEVILNELKLLKDELHLSYGIKEDLISFKQEQQTFNQQLNITLTHMTSELNEIKIGVDNANSKLDTLLNLIQNVQSTLNTILTDIASILVKLNNINTSLSTISSQLTTILNSLNVIQQSINSLSNLVTSNLNIIITDLQQFINGAVGQVQTAISTISTPPSDISNQLLLLMQGISSNTESSLNVSKTIQAALTTALFELQSLLALSTSNVPTSSTSTLSTNTFTPSTNIILNPTPLTLSANGKSTIGNLSVNPVVTSTVTSNSSSQSTSGIFGKNNQISYSKPGKIL